MHYISTRNHTIATPIDAAIAAGLAPDGGLYVPQRIPAMPGMRVQHDLAATAHAVLSPYFADSRLRDRLGGVCASAFDFAATLRALNGPGDWGLELFHGPTAAFKDFGARFLAAALEALRPADSATTTILVATSGDTGAAVAAAFHRRPGFRVVVLYPDGGVSPRQAHGLGCWGDNVCAYRVAGSFDDCQRMVKQALADDRLRQSVALGSANSISLGRLLPQVAYYAHAALGFEAEHGELLNLIVPTGNLGNACAALLARHMGLPVGAIYLVTNANDVLPRYFAGGPYAPQPSRSTLANAMDVGAPSNFERLRHWHRDDDELRASMTAGGVGDADIRETIRTAPERHGVVPCPHTATGLFALQALRDSGDTRPWAVVATAHPAKFDSIVEPLIGCALDVPLSLAQTLARPARAEPLAVDYASLRACLLAD